MPIVNRGMYASAFVFDSVCLRGRVSHLSLSLYASVRGRVSHLSCVCMPQLEVEFID